MAKQTGEKYEFVPDGSFEFKMHSNEWRLKPLRYGSSLLMEGTVCRSIVTADSLRELDVPTGYDVQDVLGNWMLLNAIRGGEDEAYLYLVSLDEPLNLHPIDVEAAEAGFADSETIWVNSWRFGWVPDTPKDHWGIVVGFRILKVPDLTVLAEFVETPCSNAGETRPTWKHGSLLFLQSDADAWLYDSSTMTTTIVWDSVTSGFVELFMRDAPRIEVMCDSEDAMHGTIVLCCSEVFKPHFRKVVYIRDFSWKRDKGVVLGEPQLFIGPDDSCYRLTLVMNGEPFFVRAENGQLFLERLQGDVVESIVVPGGIAGNGLFPLGWVGLVGDRVFVVARDQRTLLRYRIRKTGDV